MNRRICSISPGRRKSWIWLPSSICSRGLTVVAAIHDLNLAGRYFDRLVILHRGAVLAEGTPEAVLRAEIVEKAYGGPVEIVRSGNGRAPIVLPVSRFRDSVKEQESIRRGFESAT